MKNIAEIPIHERQISIFASEKTKEELKILDWKSIGTDLLFANIFTIGFRFLKEGQILRDSYYKDIPFPIFDINIARKSFRFPPLHPKDGLVYASSDIEDDLYVPLSSFHKLMYESKMSAFTKLCSSLGAKSCRILYAEENEKDITAKVTAKNIPTNGGTVDSSIVSTFNNKNNQDVDLFMSFPRAKKIYKYETKWMNGEPTWQTLQEIRIENDIEKCIAEFNYTDEMGVTTNIASSLNGMGLNVGGKFEECKKIKYKFEVEFWPKE